MKFEKLVSRLRNNDESADEAKAKVEQAIRYGKLMHILNKTGIMHI